MTATFAHATAARPAYSNDGRLVRFPACASPRNRQRTEVAPPRRAPRTAAKPCLFDDARPTRRSGRRRRPWSACTRRPGRGGIASERRRVAGHPKRRLRVGGDHVDAVAAGDAGHGGHEHAHEVVGRGDEAAAERAPELWKAPLEVVQRGAVAAIDGTERGQRPARKWLTLARRHAAAQQRPRGRSSWSDRDRLQPDVLVEYDQVRTAAREVRHASRHVPPGRG